jgi:hypothetical protein
VSCGQNAAVVTTETANSESTSNQLRLAIVFATEE